MVRSPCSSMIVICQGKVHSRKVSLFYLWVVPTSYTLIKLEFLAVLACYHVVHEGSCRSNTIKSRCHKPRVTLSRAACHTRAMSTLIGIRLSVKGYRKIVTQTWVQVTLTPIDRHHCTHRYSRMSQSMETSIET